MKPSIIEQLKFSLTVTKWLREQIELVDEELKLVIISERAGSEEYSLEDIQDLENRLEELTSRVRFEEKNVELLKSKLG